MLESYILPLINGRYIDRVDSKIDRRSYIFFPVSNAKLNKLFDSEKANNLIYFNEVDGQDKEQQSSIPAAISSSFDHYRPRHHYNCRNNNTNNSIAFTVVKLIQAIRSVLNI
jgi:hypothetical protein